VVSLLSDIADYVEEWLFVNDGFVKILTLGVLVLAAYGAGFVQGRKVAEREALQQLAKLMLEEKAAK
jgi:hypothetical protein